MSKSVFPKKFLTEMFVFVLKEISCFAFGSADLKIWKLLGDTDWAKLLQLGRHSFGVNLITRTFLLAKDFGEKNVETFLSSFFPLNSFVWSTLLSVLSRLTIDRSFVTKQKRSLFQSQKKICRNIFSLMMSSNVKTNHKMIFFLKDGLRKFKTFSEYSLFNKYFVFFVNLHNLTLSWAKCPVAFKVKKASTSTKVGADLTCERMLLLQQSKFQNSRFNFFFFGVNLKQQTLIILCNET